MPAPHAAPRAAPDGGAAPPRHGTRDVAFIALLCGVVALLCIQVAVGLTHGFARARGGPLVALLSAPGLAFGWGGVALLIMAVPHALLAWRQSDPTGDGRGRFLAVLGAVVVAFGVGGLAGLSTEPAAHGGGRLAGGVAALLRESVGAGIASVLLGLITVPGMALGLAPLVLAGGVARVAARAAERGAKPWYPQRRVTEDGAEEPPDFSGATDVGPIRFRDEPGATEAGAPRATVSLSPPAATGAAARKHKPIAGVRYADEPLPDVGGPVSTTVEERGGPNAPLAKGVRFAAPPAAVEAPASPPPAPSVPALSELPTPVPAPSDARPGAVEVPVAPVASPAATERSPAPPEAASAGDLVAAAAAQSAASSVAYRRKLDATGLLGGAAPSVAPSAPPSPASRGTGTAPARSPTRARPPRLARPRDVAEAMRSLFSSLPPEELPPVQPEIDPPEPPPPPVDAPGQRLLFPDDGATTAGATSASVSGPEREANTAAPHAERSRRSGRAGKDPLFTASVEAALERGSASVVSLKRQLGVGYARAASLMEALVEAGVVGEMTASGSRPTILTASEWARRTERS